MAIMNFIVNLLGLARIPAFKTMRTLRALRPLRAMSRLEGMRVSLRSPKFCPQTKSHIVSLSLSSLISQNESSLVYVIVMIRITIFFSRYVVICCQHVYLSVIIVNLYVYFHNNDACV